MIPPSLSLLLSELHEDWQPGPARRYALAALLTLAICAGLAALYLVVAWWLQDPPGPIAWLALSGGTGALLGLALDRLAELLRPAAVATPTPAAGRRSHGPAGSGTHPTRTSAAGARTDMQTPA